MATAAAIAGRSWDAVVDFIAFDRAAVRDSLGIRPGEKILLSVGRLAAEKNIHVHLRTIERAVQLLAGAKRPLVLVGGGVVDSDATGDAVALAELLDDFLPRLDALLAEAARCGVERLDGR